MVNCERDVGAPGLDGGQALTNGCPMRWEHHGNIRSHSSSVLGVLSVQNIASIEYGEPGHILQNHDVGS
jgi:hypothetical protein